MTARSAAAAAVAGLLLASCGPAADPVAEGHPVAVEDPPGWSAEPVPAGEEEATDPILHVSRPDSGGDAALLVQAFPGQVGDIRMGLALAEAAREARWSGYTSGPALEISVPGTEEARRLDYTFDCGRGGQECAGTAFLLLRERDLYLVRLSWQGDLVGEETRDAVQDSLALVD